MTTINVAAVPAARSLVRRLAKEHAKKLGVRVWREPAGVAA